MSRLVPPLAERDRLLDSLEELIETRGYVQFVSGHLIESTNEYFPDPWQPTAGGARTLCRRLLTYAGIPDAAVDIEVVEVPWIADAFWSAEATSTQATPAWFDGLEEGRFRFCVDQKLLEDPERLVALLARAVAAAFRAHHALIVDDPEKEGALIDVTCIYLGFGLIIANAAVRHRSQSISLERSQWSVERGTVLSSQQVCVLLAAQAVVLDDPAIERRIARALGSNEAASFRAARAVFERNSLVQHLSIPARTQWPSRQRAIVPLDIPAADREVPSSERAPVLFNRGRIVFRVKRTASGRRALLGLMIGLLAAAVLTASIPSLYLVALLLPVVGWIAGRIHGARLRRDICSDLACERRLSPEDLQCPGCGGLIRGEIASAQDRLAAEEELALRTPEDEDLARQAEAAGPTL